MLLAEQDRDRWDRGMIAEGQRIVRECLRRNQPGPYQIQAAIGAVHSDAATAARDRLAAGTRALRPAARPGADPGRGAEPRRRGRRGARPGRRPRARWTDSTLDGYHLFHATRADLLRRLGRAAEAAAAYDAAIDLAENAAERRFLTARRDSLDR